MDVQQEVQCAVPLLRLSTLQRKDILPFILLHLAIILGGLHLVYQETIDWHLLLLAVSLSIAVHVVAVLSSTWSTTTRAFFQFAKTKTLQRATHILALPMDTTLKAEICPILGIDKDGKRRIVFQRLHYHVVQSSSGETVCQLIPLPTNDTVQAYSDRTGLTSAEVDDRIASFGTNDINVPTPTFRELYIQQITAPIFVFQVFCMILYMLDDYWYYSILTLVMLLFIERLTVLQRLKNMKELQGMKPQPYQLRVFRDRRWEWQSSDSLVPGDLISLTRSQGALQKVPADLIVLAGTCIVNEAMLTGEATPLRKEGIDLLVSSHGNVCFSDLPDPKRHCVFAGTTVLQTTGAPKERSIKPKDSGCLCFVARTGFATQEGTLVRTFMASREQASANTRESLIIILFLLIFALGAAGYVFYYGIKSRRSLHKLIVECLLIITSVIPPELPLQLSLAITNALKAIGAASIEITCTEPFRIPMAGRASVVCLDKTGTLTEDKVEFQGLVVPRLDVGKTTVSGTDYDRKTQEEIEEEEEREGEDEESEQSLFESWRPDDLQGDGLYDVLLAACTDVVDVENEQVGDPLEMAVLSSLGWRCKRDVISSRIDKTTIKKLHVFSFSSTLKRMSVVFESNSTKLGNVHLVCKGAAEVIRPRLKDLPPSYDEMHQKYACKGKRVLAIAYKSLPSVKTQGQAQQLDRNVAENDLVFAGFVIFGSPLKWDTKKVMKQLRNSSHHLVMITGDSPLTACHVARQVRIATRPVSILDYDPVTTKYSWHDAETDRVRQTGNIDLAHVAQVFQTNDICLTGHVIEQAKSSNILSEIASFVKVYARTSPRDKTSIVQAYQSLGLSTIMCGDGTNDVGALKVADAGIALVSGGKRPERKKKKRAAVSMREQAIQDLHRELEAYNQEDSIPKLGDASIAAAFTSKISSCSSVCHLIRQGRATLVVSNQMIQILALNCLINSFSLSVLYLDGIKLSDTQMTISGLAIAMSMYLVSAAKAQKKLSPERPRASSVTPYMFTSVLLQFVLHIFMMLYAISAAKAEEQLPPFDPDAHDATYKPGITNTVVFLFLLSMQASTILVTYRGKPFMQPLSENSNLLFIVGGLIFLSILGATGAFSSINETFEIVSLPAAVSEQLVVCICVDTVSAFVIDRLADKLFPASYPKLATPSLSN
eukprot:m.50971 g.50971  ORF g.50971 m.50971 type:complete len:1170 (-) comp12586_c0_seq1:39-3548(-)